MTPKQAGQIGEITDELCLIEETDEHVCEECYYKGERKC